MSDQTYGNNSDYSRKYKTQPTYLWLCAYCKNNVVVFPVKTLNPNFQQHKCDCCGKKKPCQTFKMIPKGDKDESYAG